MPVNKPAKLNMQTSLRLCSYVLVCLSLAPNCVLQANESKKILFFGDSLTSGYGIDPTQSYPSLIQEKIDAAQLNYEVIRAGVVGETSAGGLRRIGWVLQQPADLLVIALGSNDGLRGIDLSSTRDNLQGIINFAREKHPRISIVIAGMEMPPNLGLQYTQEFRELFPDLARRNKTSLIPFLLDGVGGKPELNISDGIHPNAQGHARVAENVWNVIEPLLDEG